MRKSGLGVLQRGILVCSSNGIVGEYTADPIVEDQVIVEGKVVAALSNMQSRNAEATYGATGKPLCLPINFRQSKVQIRRIARTIPFISSYPATSALKREETTANHQEPQDWEPNDQDLPDLPCDAAAGADAR